MTPDEIEQMKADIEAGTPGPWRDRYLPQHLNRITAADGFVTICDIALWQVDYSGQQTNARRIARVPQLEAEVLRLREALREAQEFLSNFNEDEPSRKMPPIQASMCVHIERKCRAALNGGTDD